MPDYSKLLQKVQGRIQFFDILRGLAVVLMVVYHIVFVLWWFGMSGVWTDPLSWYWIIVARIALITFILVSGAVMQIQYWKVQAGKKDSKFFLRRALFLGWWALAISIFSIVFAPSAPIFFGIIHLLAVSAVLGLPFYTFSLRGQILGAVAVFVAWLIPWSQLVSSKLLDSWLLVIVGVSPPAFQTLDYVSVLPFFGWYILGMVVAKIVFNYPILLDFESKKPLMVVLSKVGMNSLMIYVMHVPLLVLLVLLYRYFLMI